MNKRYFENLNCFLSGKIPGLYIVSYGNDTLYCCTYDDKNKYKEKIIQATNEIARSKTASGDWDFHHVVERQHLADIPLKGLGLPSLDDYYKKLMPTFIINKKTEHKLLSLNRNDFNELYWGNQQYNYPFRSLSADVRQRIVNNDFIKGKLTKNEVVKRINAMIDRYRIAYLEHPVFRITSKNFLEDLKERIK